MKTMNSNLQDTLKIEVMLRKHLPESAAVGPRSELSLMLNKLKRRRVALKIKTKKNQTTYSARMAIASRALYWGIPISIRISKGDLYVWRNDRKN